MAADPLLAALHGAVTDLLAVHAPAGRATDPVDPVALVAALRGPTARAQMREATVDLASVAAACGAPVTLAATAARVSPRTIRAEHTAAKTTGRVR